MGSACVSFFSPGAGDSFQVAQMRSKAFQQTHAFRMVNNRQDPQEGTAKSAKTPHKVSVGGGGWRWRPVTHSERVSARTRPTWTVSMRMKQLARGQRAMVISQKAEGSWAFMGDDAAEKKTQWMERQSGSHKHRGLTLSAQHIRRR